MQNMGKTKSETPLISVIVPIYDVEKYLPMCIQSIIDQTYRNLEIILVHDESGDRCGEICDEFAEKDSRIKVLHRKTPTGLGPARNAGIEIARGDYLGFVDSDDAILPQMYEALVKAIIMTNAGISVCTRMQIGDNEFLLPQIKYDLNDELLMCESFSGYDATKELLQVHKKFKGASWEKLYEKSAFQEIRFRNIYAEDRDIMYEVFYRCERICYIPLKLYCYRQRIGSLTLSKWTDTKDNMVYDVMNKCMSFFINMGEEELYKAAVYSHLSWAKENYRRLEGQEQKYRKRLVKEIRPYTKLSFLFHTDYPLRRKIEFFIMGKCPELHFRICSYVRLLKGTRTIGI